MNRSSPLWPTLSIWSLPTIQDLATATRQIRQSSTTPSITLLASSNASPRSSGIDHYNLFVQDYGGLVGFRLAAEHPDRVASLVIQNTVAHEDGLGSLWQTRRDFWADRSSNEAPLRANFLSFEATRQRHVGTSPNVSLYDPDLWTDEFAFLSRPGQGDIQMDLFYDYRTNVASYPAWREWLRRHQSPLLVLWGRFDPSFQFEEAGHTAVTCPMPRCTFSMLVISHSTKRPPRLRV